MESVSYIAPKYYDKPIYFSACHNEADDTPASGDSAADVCSLPILGSYPIASPRIQSLLSHVPDKNDWIEMDGIMFNGNLKLDQHENGRPKRGSLAQDTVFKINGSECIIKATSEIIFYQSGTIKKITPYNHNLTINGVEYLEGQPITFYENGNVKEGVSAASFKGELVHRVHETVEYDSNGVLLEGSWNCFRKLFPKIELSGDLEKVKEGDILLIIKSLQVTTTEMRNSLLGIEFTEQVEALCDGGAACTKYRPFTHLILGIKYDKRNISHECAHALRRHLINFNSSFINEWDKVAGDVYFVPDYISFLIWQFKFNKEELLDDCNPYRGCMNKYGALNNSEDVATFVEKVSIDPAYVATLLDKNSPNYDHRYQAKLELLKKYNFISEEQYKTVINLTAKSAASARRPF